MNNEYPVHAIRSSSIFALITLALAAVACGPLESSPDRATGQNDAASGRGTTGTEVISISQPLLVDDLYNKIPAPIRAVAGNAAKAVSGFSTAKSVFETGIALAEVFGLLESGPSLETQFAQMREAIEGVAVDLDLKVMELERNNYLGSVHAAFTEARQLDLLGGNRLPRQTGYNVTSSTALRQAGGGIMFRRRFSERATNGAWKNVLWDKTPHIFDGNQVFEWRLAVPWYLDLVAMRLGVMAAVDPAFTTSGSFNVELNEIRGRLAEVFQLMVEGVRCGHAHRTETWLDENYFEHTSYWRTEISCADVNTGASLITEYYHPNAHLCVDIGMWDCDLSETSDMQAIKEQLQGEIWSGMPTYAIQAMIDTLTSYADSEDFDLTEYQSGPTGGRIPLDAAPGLCLSADTGPAFRARLGDCGSGEARMSYNRKTGQIHNALLNKCLEVQRLDLVNDNYRITAVVRFSDCVSPAIPRQQWTYNSETRLIRSAFNLALDVTQGDLRVGTGLWLYHHNGSGAQLWQAQQPVNLALSANAVATVSSDPYGRGANVARDGNRDGAWAGGSVTHSDSGTGQSWAVDLGAVHSVRQINIYNRTDCCWDRLSNFQVMEWDSSDAEWRLLADFSNHTVTDTAVLKIPVQATTRHIMIQKTGPGILSLAEVEVMGT